MQYIFWYKITCLLVGLSIVFLGYKLFVKGIFTEAGDMAGNWKNFNLIIKKAAPGLYFVVFGSIVISTTIYKGFSSTDYSREEQPINKPPVITSLPSLINDTFNLKK